MMLPLFLTPFARLPPRKTSCRGLHTWDNWQNRGEGTPDRITYFEKLPIKQALFRWAYRARAFCDLPRDARVPLGRFFGFARRFVYIPRSDTKAFSAAAAERPRLERADAPQPAVGKGPSGAVGKQFRIVVSIIRNCWLCVCPIGVTRNPRLRLNRAGPTCNGLCSRLMHQAAGHVQPC